MIFDAIVGIFVLAGIFFFIGYLWKGLNLKVTVDEKCSNEEKIKHTQRKP
jgi:hypothetical protein